MLYALCGICCLTVRHRYSGYEDREFLLLRFLQQRRGDFSAASEEAPEGAGEGDESGKMERK